MIQPEAMPQADVPQQGMTVNNPLAAPSQTGLQLGLVEINGRQQVLAMPCSASTVMTCILTPDEADVWATQLHTAAVRARTGLIIPPNGTVLPTMNGHTP